MRLSCRICRRRSSSRYRASGGIAPAIQLRTRQMHVSSGKPCGTGSHGSRTRRTAMAVITATNPSTVRAPTGYTHSMMIVGEQRRLIMSGQVGMALDGTVPATGEGQIAQAFANLRALLEANGMAVTNLVK